MDINIKDRDINVNAFRIAINMVGINIDYKTADLITRVINGVNERGDEFDIKDAAKIEQEWQNDMDKYFKKNKNE